MTQATRLGIFWTSTVSALALVAVSSAAAAPQTTKTAGAPAVATAELKGEVVQVEGSDLVVKLASGEVRTFRVPASRRFIIDGRELTVHDLQPGTTLTATTTTTTTPVSVRTKSIRTATVWYAAPPNVILTLPNGENKQYVVKDDVTFTVDGRPSTVFDLRKGMKVSVEKIVEEPTVEIAENISVVGHAPVPKANAPAAGGGAAASGAPAAGSPPVAHDLPVANSGVAAGSAPAAGAAADRNAAGGGAAASSGAGSGSGTSATPATDPTAASSAAQEAEAQAESGTSPLLWVGLIVVLGVMAAFFFRSKAKA